MPPEEETLAEAADRTANISSENPAQESPAPVDATQDESATEQAGETPPSYEPFNLPDGVSVADEDLAVFTELGSKYGLPQEGAQELVDLALRVQEASLSQFSEQLESVKAAEAAEWQEALQSDKELGGDNLATTEKNMNMLLNSDLVSDELHQLFSDRGLYTHPAVARFMSTLGSFLAEDSPSLATSPGGSAESRAQRMFGNSTPN